MCLHIQLVAHLNTKHKNRCLQKERSESCVFTAKYWEITVLNCPNWNCTQMLIMCVELPGLQNTTYVF